MINIINSESSFNDIDSWIKDLRSFSSPDVKVFLIGNKADLEESRVVSKEQALQVQKDFDLDLFMETSAKTGFNAQNLFIEASKILYGEFLKYKNNTIKKVGKKLDKKEAGKKKRRKKKKKRKKKMIVHHHHLHQTKMKVTMKKKQKSLQ